MKKAKIVALCGVISALCVVLLMAGSLVEILDITMAVIASILVLVMYEEIRYKSLFVYAVTSLAGALICPNKLVVVEFVIFGLYPIIKKLSEKTGKVLSLIIRVAYSIVSSLVVVLIMRFVFLMESNLVFDVIYFVGNLIVFILYDVAIKKFLIYYHNRLRSRLRIDKFFD
ncbi:MAG: hypothetical protein IJ004_03420 [Clostridia bacterium]|nr:hypothetical protein [Clostridia bacterium]